MKTARLNYQHVALVVLFVATVYYPSLFAKFNSIDDLKMIGHLLNLDHFNLKELFIPNSSGQYYRPLLSLTYIADKYFWGLEASFMHLENILLHVGNSLVVFLIVRQLLSANANEAPHAPLVAALVFGLHPIATEPVNWISGRTDLLAGFFVLSALFLFLAGVKHGSYSSIESDSKDKGNKRIAASVLPYLFGFLGAISLFAGCLSKETALFILPVILLWSLFPPKDYFDQYSSRLRLLFSGLFSLAGLCYLILRWLALSGGDKIVRTMSNVGASVHDADSSVNNVDAIGLLDLVRVVLKTAGFYFKKLILPLPLNFGIDTISPHYFWLGVLVMAGIIFCLFKRNSLSYLFLAAFMLASSAFILPILKITWTPIAERYVYIASAPFIIGTVLFYLRYISKLVPVWLTTVAIAVLLGGSIVITAERNVIWQDNFTLFKDTMEKSPGFGAIINSYAVALIERGQIEEAYKVMLSNMEDDFQQSSLNRIRVLTNNGHLLEARSLLVQRIDKGSEYMPIMLELLVVIDEKRRAKSGTIDERQEIEREILITFEELVRLTGDPFYHYKIGKLYLELNDKVAAKTSFAKAWHGAPPNSHYREAAKKLSERL